MELKDVKELLKAFDESNSSYLSVEIDNTKIKLKKYCEQGPVVENATRVVEQMLPAHNNDNVDNSPEIQIDGEQVLAPLVGVFYAAPSPDEDAYVQVGDSVKKGQVLCLIEAMKMMSEITAPKDGVIKKIFVKNQDVVEFEQPLFLIGD
ncbi:acetyl-CoA carboxylase biotin carboxyl carrier protein [Pseudobutyrivibrio ruminis]|uniref:Biotin carboxyl carrier protein of acetyl-CoA carboxylase n=1 Tax=Pseudobutyrivibrio ruminis DSM 9787 TaxID=1123011 RepID=A0A285SK57_9FIRM|nr:acetyl-CoA carboxylase biotin carboxyl carrier protein [Pseudobutyrivibrio ruminis]SOC07969.1 acetyl-CoA carboxylase biotin carboxyl carrier protein [Pseudobutyrivibrio ruminis DSM 9787]